MEDGPLGRPQRPRPAKRSGECDHDAVQVAVEGKILKLCAVAVEEVDSPRDYDEKLAVDGQGLLHPRVMSYVTRKSQKRAFSELPLFVRPLTISPKAIIKGITSGRRFLKRPGVEVWPMPQLETSTTAGMNSPPRRRTRANENA